MKHRVLRCLCRFVGQRGYCQRTTDMSSYQSGPKRQKVREQRPGDNVDFFQGIDKIEYNNMAPVTDAASYRYYSATERVHSRPMEDWLRLSVSLTDMRRIGTDIKPAPWDDGTSTIDNSKRRIRALFDFCQRLGVRYWTALDSDLLPPSESWDEGKGHWDEIVDFIQDLAQRYKVKPMWIAPDLHSHARYNSGAFTANEATTFAHAATQIKRCLEASQRLNAECFLLWPHREGYDCIFQTDVAREIKLFAKLLKLTAECKDRLNYRCQLLIMPYQMSSATEWNQNWDLLNRYMWDVTSCLYLLKNHNLERHYKVCCAPGHQLVMANVYTMLGGAVITNDVNQYNNKQFTLTMKSIIDQGTVPPGGMILRLRARRDADLRELIALHVKYIDAAAKGLRLAASLVADQNVPKHVQQRYASYYTGFGSRLVSSDVTMEECEDFCRKNPHPEPQPPRSEHMELLLQRLLDCGDRA